MQVDGCRITTVCFSFVSNSRSWQAVSYGITHHWKFSCFQFCGINLISTGWLTDFVSWLFVVGFFPCRSLPLSIKFVTMGIPHFALLLLLLQVLECAKNILLLTNTCLCNYQLPVGGICLLTPSCSLWTWYEPLRDYFFFYWSSACGQAFH